MLPVGVYDEIEVAIIGGGRVEFFCAYPGLGRAEENLAARAARYFLEVFPFFSGVRVVLYKRIPVGAGLGGGSSDAACVLRALARLSGGRVSEEELLGLAVKLGADVPFFLWCRPALARGIGELLEPVAVLPQLWLVIVFPGFSVSAGWAYANLNLALTKEESCHKILTPKSIEELVDQLENALEGVVVEHYPVVAQLKEELLAVGAQGALMSGSGPSVFGIFADEQTAVVAARKLQEKLACQVLVAKGLINAEGKGWLG